MKKQKYNHRLGNTKPILVLALTGVLTFVGIACQIKGKHAMDNYDLNKQFQNLDPDDTEAVQVLADTIKNRARQDSGKIIKFYLQGSDSDKEKALEIIPELEELTLYPLLQAARETPPFMMPQVMSLSLEIQLNNRKKIIALLNDMLQNQTEIPKLSPEEPTEEELPPRRVCDEAYLLMRRLLNFSESEVNYELNASDFLQLSENEKDSEILKAQNAKTWTNWLKESEIEQ